VAEVVAPETMLCFAGTAIRRVLSENLNQVRQLPMMTFSEKIVASDAIVADDTNDAVVANDTNDVVVANDINDAVVANDTNVAVVANDINDAVVANDTNDAKER
jgi:hypothetical protein